MINQYRCHVCNPCFVSSSSSSCRYLVRCCSSFTKEPAEAKFHRSPDHDHDHGLSTRMSCSWNPFFSQARCAASAVALACLISQIHVQPCSAITRILSVDPPATKPEPEPQESLSIILDKADTLSEEKERALEQQLQGLEEESGWKLKVLTRRGPSPSPSESPLREQWKLDDTTVVVVEDITSPNILNFGVGTEVSSRLPRQFFIELQSRYGNKFFVSEEGYQQALIQSIDAITQCIVREEGCKNVPGLTNDLYYLTLATSIAGGAVFGFGARLGSSLKWAFLLSPLWIILFFSFGVLPVVGRTSDLEPLLKNALAFMAAAVAFYLTPIFGKSPIN